MRLKPLLLCIILTVFLVSCSTFPVTPENTISDGEALFHFIDVGQGDCILIQAEDSAILIDAGTYESGSSVYKYISDLGIKKLDCFIATHPHEDHLGGAATVLSGIDCDTVYVNGDTSYSGFYERFVDTLLKKQVSPVIPDLGVPYRFGSITLTFLSPGEDFGNLNDNSLVTLASFGDTTCLLMGDAESDVEKEIIKEYAPSADILKIGHHGSRNASSSKFLNEVSPSVCVIQCGEDNSYGHPHKEAVDRIKNIGSELLRTDTDGSIIIRSNSKKIYDSSGNEFEKISISDNLTYIGNKKSKTYHTSVCPNLPSEKNRVNFDSSEEAESKGYNPCRNCNP